MEGKVLEKDDFDPDAYTTKEKLAEIISATRFVVSPRVVGGRDWRNRGLRFVYVGGSAQARIRDALKVADAVLKEVPPSLGMKGHYPTCGAA
jgi:hypothetical protein